MADDFKTRTAQHGLRAGQVGNPPIGGVFGITVLDEIHSWKTGPLENRCLVKGIVVLEWLAFSTASHQRLEYEQILDHVLMQQIEREQRMSQVIQHPHEENDVKLLLELRYIIDGHLPEFDIAVLDLGGKARLGQVIFIE